jgi:hypothetical protein
MGSSGAERGAEELGRKAARLLRRSRPAIEKAVAQARPRVEQAAKDAWRYTQAHEDEIKRTALRAARTKVRGPFGFVFEAVSSSLRERPAGPPSRACGACDAANVMSAKFCSQCGTAITDNS